jgi:hypothetical protein
LLRNVGHCHWERSAYKLNNHKMPKNNKIVIDLSGPDGNAFVLLSIARQLGEAHGKDGEMIKQIEQEMAADDYEHLLQVFEKNFSSNVVLLNRRSSYRE